LWIADEFQIGLGGKCRSDQFQVLHAIFAVDK
jgi:hypothetical protein